MRRKTGIVVGACAALALVGSTSAAAWHYSTGRPVGSWHDAPVVTSETVPDARMAPGSDDPTPGRTLLPESAPGRQKTGELLQVDRALDDQSPQREQTFHYPAASYVKLHFSRMMMGPGDYLTVSNPDRTESYRYQAAPDSWAMSVSGDTARLELHRAAGGDALLGVTVDQVARGYTPAEQRLVPEAQLLGPAHDPREESVCGTDESADAACYKSADPVAYTRSKAIARLLINGTELCTGWRAGPKNRMVTNNHCLNTAAEAGKTEVWFNYQCTRCGGSDPRRPTKVWGDKILATDHVYDYTLFSVTNFGSVKRFGHLSLDPARPVRGQELYVPQHPAGEPTRIAGALGDRAGTCAVTDNRYDGYTKGSDVAYYCDTEGGSSGSPVISRKTDKVVALHHFGGCPNSGVRGDLLYYKLKSLL